MRFMNSSAGAVVKNLLEVIHVNRDYLSEIDGKIGDGDHGINMDKGFTLCKNKLEDRTYSMSEGLSILGRTLVNDIGGSMGPLYGVFFEELSAASMDTEEIDAAVFEKMLKASIDAILDIGGAKLGDKTLLDTLIPAAEAYSSAMAQGKSFEECLEDLKAAARKGWLSTEGMIAKMGRASRLGERSRGVLDAGATSCYLIVNSMAETMQELLRH